MTTILAFLLYSFVLLLSKLTRESVELSQSACEELPECVCPTCSSEHLIKNGSVPNGEPKHQCKSCGHQFVVNPTNSPVSKEIKQLIDRLLLEKISLPWNCQSDSSKLVLVTRLSQSKASSDSPPGQDYKKTIR